MKYSVLCLLIGASLACSNPASRPEKPVYFDVAGYVGQQVKALSAQHPSVSKRTQMNGEVEQQTTQQINWSRELELFAQADINKPALRSSYTIDRPDSLTYLYTLKPGEKELTVRSLQVRLDAATRKPHRIDAVLASENPIYESERQIELESGARAGGTWGVTHYRLRGYQQLRMTDRNTFDVEGTVR